MHVLIWRRAKHLGGSAIRARNTRAPDSVRRNRESANDRGVDLSEINRGHVETLAVLRASASAATGPPRIVDWRAAASSG